MEEDFYLIVKDILESEEFLKRKTYNHHGQISVYDHSLNVSLKAYRMAKKFKHVDEKSVAIGALLHDFYYRPWQEYKEKRKFFQKHGFVHAREALENSKKFYPEYMNPKIENIIERHMFPLNKIPPKYKEAWLVSLADKIISLEALAQPKYYLKMLGLK